MGREDALERWLIEHLDELAEHGLPVALAHHQHVLPNGTRPDLICRLTEDCAAAGAGDWLVVELKATRYYAGAADQVAGYVEQVQAHLATNGELVFGLLVTDGADHAEVEHLRVRSIGHLSLAALGCRLALAQEKAPTSASALSAPASMVTGMGTQNVEPLPLSEDRDRDGPTVYWLRLFDHLISSPSKEARERATAASVWSKREERRRRYTGTWGEQEQWPAQ